MRLRSMTKGVLIHYIVVLKTPYFHLLGSLLFTDPKTVPKTSGQNP